MLKDVCLSVEKHARIGLIGANGCGKSTLLRLICGQEYADEGVINKETGAVIGFLAQDAGLERDNSIIQELRSVFSDVLECEAQMRSVENEMSGLSDHSGERYKELEKKYAELSDSFTARDGYGIDVKIRTVINGMGFGDRTLHDCINDMSGGEKTRLALAKLLLEEPDLLILDEPTNHLDFSMLNWLEEYLKSYKGAVIIVSHDRYFLNAVASDICEIENGELVRYKGGYSSFLTQKEERIKTLTKEYEKQQREIEDLRDYVRRNLAKSSSINSVGSRVKALEKMELAAKPNPQIKDLHISFPFDIEPHKTILECKGLKVSVGKGETKRTLFENFDLVVSRDEKIAFVGKNGVGKSSFLKAILKKLPCEGVARWGGNVKVSYFDQELSSLDLNMTVLETVHRRFPTKTEYEIRSMLARFLIEDEDVFKRIREMSGANRAKVALCIIVFERSNVLVLDEPTNHLDYKAKEALDKALKEYSGTIIMVSHDRYLLNSVPTKIIEMSNNGITIYNGNYDYYKEHSNNIVTIETHKEKTPSDSSYNESRKNKAEDRKRRAKLMNVEKEMENLQNEIASLKSQCEDPDVSSDYQKLSEILNNIKEKEEKLEELETLWLELA